ncbi:MAG: YtxH domain-containing protein [Gemmatimonadaceae bacterium]|nr:YtxH domain-containing protein [Gemmatimonadaceae bacterium]
MSDYELYEDDEPYIVVEQHSSGVGPLLLGIALGTGIALLFAPQSGADTRRLIRKKAREAKNTVADVVDEVASTVTDGLSRAKEGVEDRIDSARDAVELKKRQISRAVRAGRDAAHEAREDLEFRIAETKAAYKEN